MNKFNKQKLSDYINFYNNKRFISLLVYITIRERIKNIMSEKSTISAAPWHLFLIKYLILYVNYDKI